MFNHLMLDIETMGNEPYSSIVSIGAVEFDIETGDLGKQFYCGVDLKSCTDVGLLISPSTVIWWMKQSKEAREKIYEGNKLDIGTALTQFDEFINGKSYYVWANSPRFDCGILGDAYRKLNRNTPWDFRKERDVRTLEHPGIYLADFRTGVSHDPIDDCLSQIKFCVAIWKII